MTISQKQRNEVTPQLAPDLTMTEPFNQTYLMTKENPVICPHAYRFQSKAPKSSLLTQ